jgi:hypothetical protein
MRAATALAAALGITLAAVLGLGWYGTGWVTDGSGYDILGMATCAVLGYGGIRLAAGAVRRAS